MEIINTKDKPAQFEYLNGAYIIDKRIGLASVRVALEPDEIAELVELYMVNSQPWGDAS